MEQFFVARYEPWSDPAVVGSSRIKDLVREVCARIMWIDPGDLNQHKLRKALHMTDASASTLIAALNFHLSEATKSVFGQRLTHYVAKRCCGVLLHIQSFVLKFMLLLPQFSPFADAFHTKTTDKLHAGPSVADVLSAGPETWEPPHTEVVNDISAVLMEQLYFALYRSISKTLRTGSSILDSQIASIQPMFYDMANQLMNHDSGFVRDWMTRHPKSQYSLLMAAMLERNASSTKSDSSKKKDTRIVKAIKNMFKGSEPVLSSPSAATAATVLDLSFGGTSKESHDSNRVSSVVGPSKAFIDSLSALWSSARLKDMYDRSDAIMTMCEMTDSPDAISFRWSQHRLTDYEVRQANYVFHRAFRSRGLDFVRFLTNKLSKTTVDTTLTEILMFSWEKLHRQHVWLVYQHLCAKANRPGSTYELPPHPDAQPDDEQPRKYTSAADLWTDPKYVEVILTNRYGESKHLVGIKERLKNLRQDLKFFRRVDAALGFVATRPHEELRSAFSWKV